MLRWQVQAGLPGAAKAMLHHEPEYSCRVDRAIIIQPIAIY
jgi:hypothetical protein